MAGTEQDLTDWRAVAHEHYPEFGWTEEDEAAERVHVAELDALGVRHSPAEEWDRGPYQPLRAYGIELPALVLVARDPVSLPPGRDWLAVDHFSGGFACSHSQLVLTVLRIRPEIAEGMAWLSEAYFGSNIERLDLDQTVEYRSLLRDLLGVDCSTTYVGWSEADYPIDIEHLAALTDEVVELPDAEEIGLYVLAENSDVPPQWESDLEEPDPDASGSEESGSEESGSERFVGQADYNASSEEDPVAHAVRHGPEEDHFLPLAAHGLKPPTLVLATMYSLSRGQRVNAEKQWHAVKHSYLELIATVLEPRPELAEALATLANEYTCRVHEGTVPLDEILVYRERLRELLGADCTASFGRFDTGVCPIDVDHVETLTGRPLSAYVTALPRYRLSGWEVLLLLPMP